MYNDWRDKHNIIINEFLEFLNKRTNNFILKGGISLLKSVLCSR